MTTTLFRTLTLAALLAAAPKLARPVAAQRSGNVHASAVVTGSVQTFELRPDSARIQPTQHTQRLAIAGLGALEVQTAPGAITHLVPREARMVRVTIDFVAN